YANTRALGRAWWIAPLNQKDWGGWGVTGKAVTVRRDQFRVRRKGEDQEQLQTAPPLAAPYDNSISYLIAVVAGKIKPAGLSALDSNVTVTRILDAARESARTGKTVKLPNR